MNPASESRADAPVPPLAHEPVLRTVYGGGNTTVRLLRAMGWGPALLNLGYYRWRGALTPLNLWPNRFRLAGAQQRLVREAVALASPLAGQDVLDVACGRGQSSFYMASCFPGTQVLGLDQLGENIAVASALFGTARGLGYIQGDAQALACEDASYDRVYCIEAAFHFPDKKAFIAEVGRVLRPGGKLVLVDFMWRDELRRRQRSPLNEPGLDLVRETWGFADFFSQAQYTDAGLEAGLAVAQVCDWSGAVTGPLTFQFLALTRFASSLVGRQLLVKQVPELASLSRSDWRDLSAAAQAHRYVHQQAQYTALVFTKVGTTQRGAEAEAPRSPVRARTTGDAFEEICAAVQDLGSVPPWPGIWRTLLSVLILNGLLFATFAVSSWAAFLILAVVTGVAYCAAMMTTHDAIHHTLSGRPMFDEVAPRALSYFIFWPHGVYSELHKIHHRLSGRSLMDPEQPTPTLEQYESAGPFGRWTMRHHLWLRVFGEGGLGLILRHVLAAREIAKTSSRMRRLLWSDAIGIACATAVTFGVIAYFGVTWRYLVYLLIVERIIGFCQQLRSHLEHYGLHGAPGVVGLARLYDCRNIRTNVVTSAFFDGLNFHSVHHGFPWIPFRNLGEAHRRASALCDARGRPLPEGVGYLRTLKELAQAPVLLTSDGPVPVPSSNLR